MDPQPAQTYIVRIWWEQTPDGEGRAWRASLTEVHSKERRYFKSPEDLMRYLSRRSGEPPAQT
ncbi:hypothetical protein [Calidithermus roseus]|uniref:Uncharacterized protein n=1 Tax=Calidithermus roseus TaxID=1644118 RepID=A0A399F0Z3_9DEIN|nr:hypothetical protein [Calidithermus roseus]RIH89475.1 hypothetical protein Mrose_00376 [Calidithermus roseus]